MGKAYILLTEAEILSAQYKYDRGLANTYLNEAEILRQRGYTRRALELFYQSLDISRKINDDYITALTEQYISSVKRKAGDFALAEKLLSHALGVFKKLNKPTDQINALLRMGILKTDQGKYAEAGHYYDQAYALSLKYKYNYGEKKSYYHRARMFEKRKLADSAIAYLNKSLRLDTLTADTYGKAGAYNEMARIYLVARNYNDALKYAQLAYNKADSAAALELKKAAAQSLVEVNKAFKRSNEVIKWQDELLYITSTLASRELNESTNFIDVLRKQQERQISMQQRVDSIQRQSHEKNKLIFIYSGFLVLFLFIMAALNYNYARMKRYSAELKLQKQKIEDQIAQLDQLNTEVLQQNQRLEDDNNLKSRLLSIISHDLRKPLANTQSLVELYNMGVLADHEVKDLFQRLDSQYSRAMTLTNNILFWIRGQLNGMPAELVQVNVYDTVKYIIEEQQMVAAEKGISVENGTDPDLVWKTEREALQIVIRNLLNNAIKFTPTGGTVRFLTLMNDECTTLIVKDNGVGMTEETIRRINDEGYYTSKGTSEEEGSGFGLMLIRDLLKKQKGQLKLSSVPGKGSAFSIIFPADVAEVHASTL